MIVFNMKKNLELHCDPRTGVYGYRARLLVVGPDDTAETIKARWERIHEEHRARAARHDAWYKAEILPRLIARGIDPDTPMFGCDANGRSPSELLFLPDPDPPAPPQD